MSSDSSDNSGLILWGCLAIASGCVVKTVLTRSNRSFLPDLPYSVVVLFVGLLLGLLELIGSPENVFIHSEIIASHLNPNTLLYVFLPALIFDSAFNIRWKAIQPILANSILLAVGGVIFSLITTAIIAKYCFDYGWSWNFALMFGSILAATDPVAVVAILKELGAPKHLELLVEGESLLNDGSAYVFYLLFLDLTLSESQSGGSSSVDFGSEVVRFLRLSAGGPLFGLAFGFITVQILNRVFNDLEFEVVLGTLISAYSCFYLASQLEVSAVLAVVVFGLYLSKYRNCISPDCQPPLLVMWRIVSFIANTLIFILTGIIAAEKVFINRSIGAGDFGNLLLLFVALNLFRALCVLLFVPLFRLGGYDVSLPEGIMLSWSGLRGALSLLLGLLTALQADLDQLDRDRIVFQIAGTAILTLLVNGTTAKAMVEFLGLNRTSPESKMCFQSSLAHMKDRAQKFIDAKKRERRFQQADWDRVATFIPENVETQETEETISGRIRVIRDYLRRNTSAQRQRQPGHTPAEHTANLRSEIIRRFLSAMRTEYQKQYSLALISRSALMILLEAAESGEASASLADQWHVVSRNFDYPSWLSALFSWPLTRRFPSVQRLVDSLMFSHRALAVELAISVLAAKSRLEQLVSDFPELDNVDRAVTNEVRAEAGLYQRKAFQVFTNIQRAFPESYAAIQTRQLSFYLLMFERSTAANLRDTGMLEENEYSAISEAIEKEIYWLERAPIKGASAAGVPSFDEIVLNFGLLDGLAAEQRRGILDCGARRLFRHGEAIATAGELAQGVFLVVRGIVACRFQVAEAESDEQTEPQMPEEGRVDLSRLFEPAAQQIEDEIKEAKRGEAEIKREVEMKIFTGNAVTTPKKSRSATPKVNKKSKFFKRLDFGSLRGAPSPVEENAEEKSPDDGIRFDSSTESDTDEESSGTAIAQRPFITEKSGSETVIGSYSVLTGFGHPVTVRALTSVEALFVPESALRSLLLSSAIVSERVWRIAAEKLLKASFAQSLAKDKGVRFECITPLLARAVFHREETGSREFLYSSRSSLLLVAGQIFSQDAEHDKEEPEGDLLSSRSWNSLTLRVTAAPALLINFPCRTRCRFLKGSVWLAWAAADEAEVRNAGLDRPITSQEEAQMLGISIGLGEQEVSSARSEAPESPRPRPLSRPVSNTPSRPLLSQARSLTNTTKPWSMDPASLQAVAKFEEIEDDWTAEKEELFNAALREAELQRKLTNEAGMGLYE